MQEITFAPPLPTLTQQHDGVTWSDVVHSRVDSMDAHRLENYSWRLWHMRRNNLARRRDQQKDKLHENRQFRRWAVEEKRRKRLPHETSPERSRTSSSGGSSWLSDDLAPPPMGKADAVPPSPAPPQSDVAMPDPFERVELFEFSPFTSLRDVTRPIRRQIKSFLRLASFHRTSAAPEDLMARLRMVAAEKAPAAASSSSGGGDGGAQAAAADTSDADAVSTGGAEAAPAMDIDQPQSQVPPPASSSPPTSSPPSSTPTRSTSSSLTSLASHVWTLGLPRLPSQPAKKSPNLPGSRNVTKTRGALKRSNSMDGSRDHVRIGSSEHARVGEGPTLFNKPPSFDGQYLRQLLASSSSPLRRQTWLLLAKYSMTLYLEQPATLTQCADALFVASSHVPSLWREQIMRDVPRTCLHPFFSSNEGQQRLLTVLLAHSDWNSSVGYCQSLSFVCAALLAGMDPASVERYGQIDAASHHVASLRNGGGNGNNDDEDTDDAMSQSAPQETDDVEVLLVLRALVDVYLPENFYSGRLEGLVAEVLTLEQLIELHLPRLFRHLMKLTQSMDDEDGASVGGLGSPISILDAFLVRWLSTLFSNSLPLPFTIRVLDALLCDGIEILHRVALAVLREMEPAILEQHEYYDCCDAIKAKSALLHDGQLVPDPQTLLDSAYSIGGMFPWNGFHARRAQCHKEQQSGGGFAAAAAALADTPEVVARKRMDRFWSEMALL